MNPGGGQANLFFQQACLRLSGEFVRRERLNRAELLETPHLPSQQGNSEKKHSPEADFCIPETVFP
jgi:hypothetical protein